MMNDEGVIELQAGPRYDRGEMMTGDHGSVRDLEPIDKDGSGTLHCFF